MQPRSRARAEGALAALALGALLAPTLPAQDSVSKLSGVANSDAVDPFTASEVRNDYVLDLTPFTTSWGTELAIGPLAKASQPDTVSNFTALISAQGISRTSLDSATFDGTSYGLWTTAGEGVNGDGTINDPPSSSVTPNGPAQQWAAAFSEFGNAYNGVITTLVRHDAANPTRLYVSRIASMVNAATFGEVCSSTGFGTVDADGNTYFRADDFGAFPCGTTSGSIVGNNVFRVRAAARNAAMLNVIDNGGGSDAAATDWLVVNSMDTYNVPNSIPEDVAGRPVYSGTNFNAEYAYEATAGVISTTTAHRTPASDQRGNPCYQLPAFLGTGAVGTNVMLGKDAAGETRRLLMWGVDANGAVTGTRNDIVFTSTMTITDNSDGHVFGDDTTYPTTPNVDEPLWHTGSTAFRGGNGQVAVGLDQAGRALVATSLNLDNTAPPPGMYGITNPICAVAVARFDPNVAGGEVWTLAGYSGSFVDGVPGKAILDGPGGTAIGRMCTLQEATGGTVLGPSTSAPVVDSVGNVIFVAAVELFDPMGGPSDFDNAVLRAVYDPTTFSYELELVLQLGDVFTGQNSGIDYQIRFFGIATTGGGPNPSSMWSGNVMQNALNNVPTAALAPSDPATLGGLVLAAGIIYDADMDGSFDAVTGASGDPLSDDQEYQVLLYIGAREAVGPQSFCDNSDGSLASCPCGNPGFPNTGCDSPIPGMLGGGLTGGIRLDVVLQQISPMNRMTLSASGYPLGSNPAAVIIRADALDPVTPVVFGDGIRCIGVPLVRLGATIAGSGTSEHAFGHGAMAGTGTFYYQCWFRSTPMSYCDPTAAFNLSNGQSVVW